MDKDGRASVDINRVQINYYNDEGISFLIWNGKNCYLTKSQAEARLKELKGEEGV